MKNYCWNIEWESEWMRKILGQTAMCGKIKKRKKNKREQSLGSNGLSSRMKLFIAWGNEFNSAK